MEWLMFATLAQVESQQATDDPRDIPCPLCCRENSVTMSELLDGEVCAVCVELEARTEKARN